jgi:hypothetical protein
MTVCELGEADSEKSGAGALMPMLSKVDAFSTLLLCAVTAKPAVALLAMVTLMVLSVVQVTPSAEL